jgi:hypothetical protein
LRWCAWSGLRRADDLAIRVRDRDARTTRVKKSFV